MTVPLKPTEPQPGLGRVYEPNPGSRFYPLELSRAARKAAAWRSKTWQMGSGAAALQGPHGSTHSSGRGWQSQGATSHCVRYGCTHVLLLEAVVRLNAWELTHNLYPWGQDNDAWPGAEPTYYGTSVDAGLQFLRKQIGVISEYRWARSMDDVLGRLCARAEDGGGPLIIGSDWYSNMDNPEGYPATLSRPANWRPDGRYRGGHCWVARGYRQPSSFRSGKILCGNSHLGNFEGEMDVDAFEWLIFGQNGEAAAITEVPRAG